MDIIKKLENPTRLEELKPVETLKKIGLRDEMTFCDIGAGTGIFTIPAAKMTSSKVYALEINHEMLSLIKEKAESQNIGNIELIEVKNNHFNMEGNIIDLAVIVTVLHEVKNQSMFLAEVKRILKADGNVAIIEFHKRATPVGPSIDHRLSDEDLSQILRECDFSEVYKFDLGQSFYCTVVKPNQKK